MAGWQDDPVVQPAGWQSDAVVDRGGTRLYSPNPDAPTSYGAVDTPATGVSIPRIVGQFAQGNNDAWANTLGYPVDLVNSGARFAGLQTSDTPVLGSQSFRNIFDYISTLPGRARDAISEGALTPFTESRTARFAPENRAERIANDVGSAVGSTASNMVPGFAMAKAATPGFRAVGEALKANPVAQTGFTAAGNIASSETDNPYVGAGVSLALPMVTHGVQRTVSANLPQNTQEAERRALLEFGRQNNLGPLTAGKILDSKGLQTLESAASKLPLPVIGGRVAATESAGRDAFQRTAIAKATGSGTAVTPDVVRANAARIGQNFDAFKPYSLSADPPLNSGLDAVEKRYTKQFMASIEPGLMERIDELRSGSAPGNLSATIDGETFQNLRSDLSALSAKGGKTGRAAGQLVEVLDDWAERQLPKDVVDDYRTARQQWRNNLALGKSIAANNEQTAVGNMSTAAFARAARGNPDLETLARYGTAFVGDKMANTSRTASHNIANHLLGGGLVAGPLEAYHQGMLTPGAMTAAAAVGALPYAFELGLNNPATRAALLARYRNATPSFVTPSLAGASVLNALKGLR